MHRIIHVTQQKPVNQFSVGKLVMIFVLIYKQHDDHNFCLSNIDEIFRNIFFDMISPCCNLILVFSFGICPVLVLHLLPLLCQIPPLLSWHLFTA